MNILNTLSEAPELWNDRVNAQKILRERSYLKNATDAISKLEADLASYLELIELSENSNDDATIQEAEKELINLARFAKLQEVECLLSGEADQNDTFLEIHAGAGGTESHDWAEMLFRMYGRWAERHSCKVELIDKLNGEEAGIKSVTIKIMGLNSYGWLKSESGVHRLVRISPFNAAGKRHTSFASVWVFPVIDDSINIEISESELRIDTYRSSGAGGQHVNTTDSAVRITHIPTNIVVQCQNNRSQHRNKEECYTMLKSRLYEFELKKRMDALNTRNSNKTDNGWGNQIRSYVLHPYQLVKDNRTDYQDSDAHSVLDGKLDEFMKKNLEKMAEGQGLNYESN